VEGIDPALARSIEAARRRVPEEPRSPAAWGHLGKVLLAASFNEPAAACLAEAERLDPGDPRWPYLRADALLGRDLDAALPLLRRAAELCDRTDPANTAPRLRLAETLLGAGKSEEAESELRLVLQVEPDNPRAHLDLGLLAHDRGDLAGSRTHLEKCQESPWTRQRACNQLAAVHQRLGDPKAAAAYSRRAAAFPPDRPWDDPFVREYRKLAQVGGNRYRTVESLEAAGHHAEAVRLLGEMVQESPDYRSYIGLGKNLIVLGDYVRAEQALRAAVEMAPDKAQAYYFLSKLFLLRGEQSRPKAPAEELFQSAADFARQAIDRKPDHAMAYLSLGLSLKHLGRRPEAIAALRAAVQYSPDSADLYLLLGEALAEDGQTADARTQLQRASQLARPDDPRPRAALQRLGAAETKTP
jgi:tetratricopeptide (TPR) repeat protein